MSSASSSDVLRLERELAELRITVSRLQLRVSELETKQAEGFVVIPEEPQSVTVERTAPTETVREVPSSSVAPQRKVILDSIGSWLRTCLREERRGLSGREKLVEGSKLYLVVKSFEGAVFNPVKICTTWAETQAIVKPKGICGGSIFVGLPRIEDAKTVTQAAGLEWPSSH